jgi:hypothetical protein
MAAASIVPSRRDDPVRALCLLSLLLAGTLLMSCRPGARPPVDDSTLVALLVDLHLLEAEATAGTVSDLDVRRDSLFETHAVSEEAFRASMMLRQQDLEAYREMYDAILARLNEIRLEDGARSDTIGQIVTPQPDGRR